MTRLGGFDISAPAALAIPLLLAVLLAVGLALGHLATRLSRGWFRGRGGGTADGDPDTAPALTVAIGLAAFSAGLVTLAPDIPDLGRYGGWVRTGATILLVGSCAVALTRLAVAGVSEYAGRRPTLAPAISFARMAVRIAIAILAALTGLQALGVPVTPLLTTLGIGSLAVALALQDTLANFFAGLYLLADRPVRPGDYIKLAEGAAEGYVDTIGWRASRLRTQQGNTVIVPNQKLSQTIITNFNLPLPDMVLAVPVTVPFEVDADVVEGYLLEEMLQASRDLKELLPREPAVRLTEFGDRGMTFTCVARVSDYEAQGLASHEIRKRILARLRHERVPLAYPHQVVEEAPAVDRRKNERPPPARPER